MRVLRTVSLWSTAMGVALLLAAGAAHAQAVKPKKVDLNTATPAELEKLPGVGEATAKKIVAGRPYASLDDFTKKLTEAKVPKATIDKITPLAVVSAVSSAASPGAAAPPAAAPGQPSPAPKPDQTATAKTTTTPEATQAQTPPEKGMVWVNTESKIFHREGDRWYGKTKQGKWMSEADALKAGYRAAKN